MRMVPSVLVATLCCCGRSSDRPLPPPPKVTPPVRGAVGDSDLRVMLAEVASAKACEMIKGAYRPLLASDDPSVVTGLLSIRDCKITNDGTHVTYELAGVGWQWADQTQKKGGGTFVMRDYVKFGVKATLEGSIDIAYDTGDHVVSLRS